MDLVDQALRDNNNCEVKIGVYGLDSKVTIKVKFMKFGDSDRQQRIKFLKENTKFGIKVELEGVNSSEVCNR